MQTWGRVSLIVALAAAACAAAPASAPASAPGDDRLDEQAFRRGLLQRGLFELLDVYDRQHPPRDELSRAMRVRERFLRDCDDAARGAEARADACRQATAILEKIIADHPSHPDRLAWRVELGRDLVERRSAPALDALLFRVASRRQREEIAATAEQAIRTLEPLADDIAAEWQRIGALPPEQFEQVADTGRLKDLEAGEAAGAYLLAWARLYAAMVLPADDARRTSLVRRVIDEVVNRRGWTTEPHARTGLQVQSLILAAIAQRLAGEFDAADAATQQAITIYSRMEDAGRRRKLDTWALLAVLERIRLLRDRGKPAEAAAAIGRAYEWAGKARPNDAGAVVALAILARSIQTPTGRDPLPDLAKNRPEARPLIYESLGRLVQERGGEAAGPWESLGRAWVAAEDAADLDAAAALMQSLADARPDAFIAAEALFVLARCRTAADRPADAARALIRLATDYPSSDRAASAVDEALRLAIRAAAAPAPVSADARETLVVAVRLLRDRAPQHPRLTEATFAAASALEQLGRRREAAAEFARIPPTHELAAEAAVRRARCLAREFEAHPNEETAVAAVQATRDAQKQIEAARPAPRNPCWAAEVVLLRAGIQADAAVKQHEAALATLADYETRYAACPDLVRPIWRIRLAAFEALGRLKEANALVERMIAAEPDRAGAVMTELLARLREEVDRLREEGREDALREMGAETARLAERLERWAAAHPAGLATAAATRAWRPPASLVDDARLARAMALLDADRADEARRLAEDRPPKDANWQYVRAECLFRDRAYRDALPMFHQVWQAAEPGSPLWWRALLRNLQCHTEIGTDPDEVLQAIRQHAHRRPDMGGAALKRAFDELRTRNEQRRSGSSAAP